MVRTVPVPASIESLVSQESAAGDAEVRRALSRISAALALDPRIVVCSGLGRLLVPPGFAAWTLGRLVVLRSDHWEPGDGRTARLLAHELVHVAQWNERGRLRFLGRYVAHYLRGRARGLGHLGAYRAIPDEIEAYELEAAVAPLLAAC